MLTKKKQYKVAYSLLKLQQTYLCTCRYPNIFEKISYRKPNDNISL